MSYANRLLRARGVRSAISARTSKGLEFDDVVVIEPAAILSEPAGSRILYDALTRAVQELHIVSSERVDLLGLPEAIELAGGQPQR